MLADFAINSTLNLQLHVSLPLQEVVSTIRIRKFIVLCEKGGFWKSNVNFLGHKIYLVFCNKRYFNVNSHSTRHNPLIAIIYCQLIKEPTDHFKLLSSFESARHSGLLIKLTVYRRHICIIVFERRNV